MQYLPISFAIFQVFLPTALVIYYISQTILRIGQQHYITKRFYHGDGSLGKQAQEASARARELQKNDKNDKGGAPPTGKGTPPAKGAQAKSAPAKSVTAKGAAANGAANNRPEPKKNQGRPLPTKNQSPAANTVTPNDKTSNDKTPNDKTPNQKTPNQKTSNQKTSNQNGSAGSNANAVKIPSEAPKPQTLA